MSSAAGTAAMDAGGCSGLRPPAASTINALRLPLGDGDCAFHVLTPGAVVGKHVEHEEIGDCRRRLLADRAEPAGREGALGDVAIDSTLGVRRPDRILVVGVEAVRQIAD